MWILQAVGGFRDRLNRRRAVETLPSLADAIEGCCPMTEDVGQR